MAWLYVALTVTMTTYGQMISKWRLTRYGRLPAGLHDKLTFLASFLLSPWMISVLLATGVAALSWISALSHLELSRAYPFMALSFVAILLLSALFLGEDISVVKVAGVMLVITGLIIGVTS